MDLEKEKIHSQWFFDDNDILDEIWRQMSQERDKQAIVARHAEVPRDLSQFLPPLPLSLAPPAFIINLSRKRFFSSCWGIGGGTRLVFLSLSLSLSHTHT